LVFEQGSKDVIAGRDTLSIHFFQLPEVGQNVLKRMEDSLFLLRRAIELAKFLEMFEFFTIKF
jgi:hypothetical protein